MSLLKRRRKFPASSGLNWSNFFMPTKLFDTVNTYNSAPAINASIAEMLLIDISAIGGDVTVTFPVGTTEGQCIGIQVLQENGTNGIYGAGPVDSRPFSLSYNGDCALWTWDVDSATWMLVSQYHVPGVGSLYQWTWADAAERLAEAVGASDVLSLGYQADIALGFQLLGEGPSRWGSEPDPAMGIPRTLTTFNNGTSLSGNLSASVTLGTATARAQAATNAATMLTRLGALTAAGAGSIALLRSNTGAGFSLMGGCRFRTQFTLGAVSASMRWFAGMSSTIPVGNVDPATFVNSIGVGRGNGEANVQLYHNDGAGVATQIDLGADFPAATLDSAYEFEFYTFSGAEITYQLTNLSTGAAVSGVAASNLPTNTAVLSASPEFYSSNNADAVQVSLDFANLQFWQRVA